MQRRNLFSCLKMAVVLAAVTSLLGQNHPTGTQNAKEVWGDFMPVGRPTLPDARGGRRPRRVCCAARWPEEGSASDWTHLCHVSTKVIPSGPGALAELNACTPAFRSWRPTSDQLRTSSELRGGFLRTCCLLVLGTRRLGLAANHDRHDRQGQDVCPALLSDGMTCFIAL
jgi:hypothetical protein